MTQINSPRSLAVVMAVAAMAMFWIPTLSDPAQAATANSIQITVVAGPMQPVMM